MGIFTKWKSLVLVLLLFYMQNVKAEPLPCLCDPEDLECLEDNPQCDDGVPIDGNIGFLTAIVFGFGVWKLAKEPIVDSRLSRKSHVAYWNFKKTLPF